MITFMYCIVTYRLQKSNFSGIGTGGIAYTVQEMTLEKQRLTQRAGVHKQYAPTGRTIVPACNRNVSRVGLSEAKPNIF